MRFRNCICVCCNNAFSENDDVVVCPVCGSPHHRECYMEKGECSNTHLHAEGFNWVFPEELRPREEKKNTLPETIETNYRFKNGENAVVCPHCRSLNYGNDAYCMKCRRPFFESNDNASVPGSMPQDGSMGNPFADENSFEYFQRFGGVRPDIMIDAIPVIEYADYIGEKKSGRYIRRFLNMERFGRRFSVSLCAGLLGPIWYFYRKMFKEGILFLLALLLISGVQAFCNVTEFSKEIYAEMGSVYADLFSGEITQAEFEEYLYELQAEMSGTPLTREEQIKQTIYTVTDVCSITLHFVMAIVADNLYRKKIKKDIMKIREECSDMPTYRRTLHERGGASAGAAIMAGIAVFAVSAVKLMPLYFYMFSSMM